MSSYPHALQLCEVETSRVQHDGNGSGRVVEEQIVFPDAHGEINA